MTLNSLSPGFVKIKYGAVAQKHTAVIPTKPVGIPTVGVDPNIQTYGGSVLFSTAMDDWADMITPAFNASVTIDSAEFWYQATPDDDPVWIFEHIFTDKVGSNVAAYQAAVEAVMTFRTAVGGLMKLYFMGVSLTPDRVQTPALGLSNPYDDIEPFVRSNDSWIFGRDNAKIVGLITLKTKTNDVLRRKYLTG